MAPSLLNTTQPLQKSTDPAGLSTKCAVKNTNPSSNASAVYSNLQELNASRIDFNFNPSPSTVPELNSPEVWSQKVYENHSNLPSK